MVLHTLLELYLLKNIINNFFRFVAFSIENEIHFTKLNYFQFSRINNYKSLNEVYDYSKIDKNFVQTFNCKVNMTNIKFLITELDLNDKNNGVYLTSDNWNGRCEYRQSVCACWSIDNENLVKKLENGNRNGYKCFIINLIHLFLS
jgi:hypothetical protein